MADVESYISQLEGTVHRLEAKLASITDAPRLSANALPSCRTTPMVRELSPCVQIITTRIDTNYTGQCSPESVQDDDDVESETSSPVATNRRRTSVFAAVPVDGGRRRSIASHTSLDQFQPFLSASDFQRDSPNSRKKRDAASITLAVPESVEQPSGEVLSIPDAQPVDPIRIVSPVLSQVPSAAPLLPDWNNDANHHEGAANEVTWTVVSEKDVEDKGVQCTITIRANAGSQTLPFVGEVHGVPTDNVPAQVPSVSVAPTPPRSAGPPTGARFSRHMDQEMSAQAKHICSPPESERLPLVRVNSFPSSSHASLYEARRANRISSISSKVITM